jgi:hypothetical protein
MNYLNLFDVTSAVHSSIRTRLQVLAGESKGVESRIAKVGAVCQSEQDPHVGLAI